MLVGINFLPTGCWSERMPKLGCFIILPKLALEREKIVNVCERYGCLPFMPKRVLWNSRNGRIHRTFGVKNYLY